MIIDKDKDNAPNLANTDTGMGTTVEAGTDNTPQLSPSGTNDTAEEGRLLTPDDQKKRGSGPVPEVAAHPIDYADKPQPLRHETVKWRSSSPIASVSTTTRVPPPKLSLAPIKPSTPISDEHLSPLASLALLASQADDRPSSSSAKRYQARSDYARHAGLEEQTTPGASGSVYARQGGGRGRKEMDIEPSRVARRHDQMGKDWQYSPRLPVAWSERNKEGSMHEYNHTRDLYHGPPTARNSLHDDAQYRRPHNSSDQYEYDKPRTRTRIRTQTQTNFRDRDRPHPIHRIQPEVTRPLAHIPRHISRFTSHPRPYPPSRPQCHLGAESTAYRKTSTPEPDPIGREMVKKLAECPISISFKPLEVDNLPPSRSR